MMRWTLRIVGGLVLLALLSVAIAAAQIEWRHRAAAHEGTERLAHELALPPVPATAAQQPVLILLHGAGLNGQMWNAVRRSLDPQYRVIALDLPGHGAQRDGVFTFEAASADVVAAVRSVAPAPVILIGDSLGGYTAMAAAASVPHAQLAGLVLAGSSGDKASAANVASAIAQSVLLRGLMLFKSEDELATKALGMFGVSATDAPAIVAAGVNLNAVAPAMRAILGMDFRGRLAAVDAPVLIINGSLDTNAVAGEASYIAAAKHATSVRFENCEHGVSMRRPAEFAAAVNTFAARVTTQQDSP